ncbi:hypothetical protein [Streptomyces caeruleatus]|uniref:Uncharacterized protein n=1 Tax=Streptomyces caeruleatus TaxID=661399 RepID=A0A101U807_9ACTN|nr:hypothetical protein [Streptomyces caeruleatus]KUO05922.1 hypothetical protein AQJ67_03665 [Streptomyces caeruleatus]
MATSASSPRRDGELAKGKAGSVTVSTGAPKLRTTAAAIDVSGKLSDVMPLFIAIIAIIVILGLSGARVRVPGRRSRVIRRGRPP